MCCIVWRIVHSPLPGSASRSASVSVARTPWRVPARQRRRADGVARLAVGEERKARDDRGRCPVSASRARGRSRSERRRDCRPTSTRTSGGRRRSWQTRPASRGRRRAPGPAHSAISTRGPGAFSRMYGSMTRAHRLEDVRPWRVRARWQSVPWSHVPARSPPSRSR